MRFLSQKDIMKVLSTVASDLNVLDWIPYNHLVAEIGTGACELVGEKTCALVGLIAGLKESDNRERIATYMSMIPCGAGAFNFEHYGQLIHTDKPVFRRFDMGSPESNMAKYNQTQPPDYDLSVLNFPIGIFSGADDILADPLDVQWLAKQLSDVLIFSKEYPLAHEGFAIAKDMTWFTEDCVGVIKRMTAGP